MDDTDVIVIGAGLAGLTCALELERSGVSVLLLEREPTPGGRLRTGELNGTPIDLGAHFLSHRYATLRRLIAEAGLEQRLRPLTDSYCTGIWRGGSWHYLDYGRPLSMLGYSAIPFSQRARLGMMAIPLAHTRRGLRFFDIASAAAVDGLAPARLFGEEGLRYVFAPASQAFCGYSPEQISLPLLVLGARFPLRAPLTLEGGLGQLGPALAAGLRVRCGIAVERLELNAGGGVRVRAHAHAHAHDGDGDGDELHFAARAAVIATTPSAALRLWPGAPQPERDFLASARYTQHFHVYLKTNRRFRPTSPHGAALYMQILPHGERPGVLSHMSFAGGGQGPEAGLVFLAAHSQTAAEHDDDGWLAERLRIEAEELHPELRGHVSTSSHVRWREKVPLFPNGRTRELATLRASMGPGPVQLAGDYLYGPLMEGAALSGAAAARRVTAFLGGAPA